MSQKKITIKEEPPSDCPSSPERRSRSPSPSRSPDRSVAGPSQPRPVSPSTPLSPYSKFTRNLEATRAANRSMFRSPQRGPQRPQAAAAPRPLTAQDFPGGAVALAVHQRIDEEDRRDNYEWRYHSPSEQQKLRNMQLKRRRRLMEYLEELDNMIYENLDEILSTHNLRWMHNPVFTMLPERVYHEVERSYEPIVHEPLELPVWEPFDIEEMLRTGQLDPTPPILDFSDNFVSEENNQDPQMVENNYTPMFPRREFSAHDSRQERSAVHSSRPYAQNDNVVNYPPPSPSRSRSRSPSPSRASSSAVAGSSQQTQVAANRARFRSPQRGLQRPQATVGARVENAENFPHGPNEYAFLESIRLQDRREVRNLHNMSLRAIQDLHRRQEARRRTFFENIDNDDVGMYLAYDGELVLVDGERPDESNTSGSSDGSSNGEDT